MNPIKLKNPFLIAPSMLASDLSRLADEARAMETAGVDALHLDIMDGHFVPNITFGFPVIKKLREVTELPFDAHLMIENADRYLDEFAKVGCNWLSVHVEACPKLSQTLKRIQNLGMSAGVAINPETSLSKLDPVLSLADYFLVMGVHPGFEGQKFIETTFDRVRELKHKLGSSSDTRIEIDGGIKATNFGDALTAGVDIVVMGTGLFLSQDYKAAVSSLRQFKKKN